VSCSSTIFTGSLLNNSRKNKDDQIVKKKHNLIEIVFSKDDTLDSFEANLNELCGNSSFFYKLKKKISSSILSIISVVTILFALISSSLYEDVLKKLLFETPFSWTINDSISIAFVLLFFFGLLMMPSILDGESSQLKDGLQAWFNKDTRRLKRLKLSFEELDKKYQINIYNIDLLTNEHWMWKLVVPTLVKHFLNVDFYIRNDQQKLIEKRLSKLNILTLQIENQKIQKVDSNVELLLSSKEKSLYSLMHLSSTSIIDKDLNKKFISLELFEYCGRNFFNEEKDINSLISGFQNFINRAFDDFYFLKQEKSAQVYFSNLVKSKDLFDEKRRLSYYLRNHIEECLEYFENPISLLVLYYYVKDIVLDEKRVIAILEKLISSIKKKQQYNLIDIYWFDIAGKMFNAKDLDNFELTNDSIYRKLSISSLNQLKFLFERNGYFEQALLISEYLYEINPPKYSVDISSLYERMGTFDKAYESLPKDFEDNGISKPSDIEVRYLQRKSWIIVSQRKDDKKSEGLIALEKLKDLLFSHNKDNEPLWLWHYYNIKANYCEWNEDYDNAIENYKKCLTIPTLGAFEYGGTFVNMSIAYRFKYLTNTLQNINTINTSISIGNIGVLLKDSVGDRDEMPVVLHNQALNILYKIFSFEDEKLSEEVLAITNRGIKILDSTNSVKRLGIILCENIIARSILNKNDEKVRTRLIQHWNFMDDYEKEQINLIFDKFVEIGKCKPLDI